MCQYFDFSQDANERSKQFLHSILSHNKLDGIAQYGHHLPILIFAILDIKLCLHVMQLNVIFLLLFFNIFLASIPTSLINLCFSLDLKDFLKQISQSLFSHNFLDFKQFANDII
jgi:hypothetical protein